MHILHFSADYEILPVDNEDKDTYILSLRRHEESLNMLGLNPDQPYPEGININHLSGPARKSAQNVIRQRRFQRSRKLRVTRSV